VCVRSAPCGPGFRHIGTKCQASASSQIIVCIRYRVAGIGCTRCSFCLFSRVICRDLRPTSARPGGPVPSGPDPAGLFVHPMCRAEAGGLVLMCGMRLMRRGVLVRLGFDVRAFRFVRGSPLIFAGNPRTKRQSFTVSRCAGRRTEQTDPGLTEGRRRINQQGRPGAQTRTKRQAGWLGRIIVCMRYRLAGTGCTR
jgi:hypothetical protein